MAGAPERRGSLMKLLAFCLIPAIGAGIGGAAAVGGGNAVLSGLAFGALLGLLAAAFGLFVVRRI